MKKALLLWFVIVFTPVCLPAQDLSPYRIFTAKGKKAHFERMEKESRKAEVILFGEYHDNSVVHWLQLKLTKSLSGQTSLMLGAEMIEADNQEVLNRYLNGEINQKAFDTLARLWNNYKTDYKPLVDFAKENRLPFIATNIPRRYASMVYRRGFGVLDTLSELEKKWIAPLPVVYDASLPGYVKMLEMMGGHGGDNLPKAQAIKDATMAHFILKTRKPDTVFLHFNGTYHSDNYEGIYWYLKQEKPNLKILTIATVTQKSVEKLEEEHYNKADYIIVIDEDVTKTF